MYRSLSLLINSFLLALFLSSSCCAEEEPLRVGVILPLTGAAATFGNSVQLGMNLAISEYPEINQKIELFFEDDNFLPQKTISAFNQLRSFEGIEVLINAGSQTGKALSPFADRYKIPLISIASDPEVVEGKKYAVNFWVTPEEEAKKVLLETSRRGYKKIARISTIHDFPMAINSAFDKQNQSKIKIVLDEDYSPEIRDFKVYVAKLKQKSGLDAILPVLMPGQLGIFARQLRQAGIALPIFGFEFFEDQNEVDSSQGALIGSWYVNTGNPSDDFTKKFLAKYPDASLFGAANGYDSVLLLTEALKESRKLEDINKFLHSVKDFTGALGTYSATDSNTFTLPASLKWVTKDGFKLLNSNNF